MEHVFHYSDVWQNLNNTTFNWVDNGSRVQTLGELILTGSFEVVANSYNAEVALRFFVVVFQTQVVLEYLQGTSRTAEFVTDVVYVLFVRNNFTRYCTQSFLVGFNVAASNSCNGSCALLVFGDVSFAFGEVLETELGHCSANGGVHLASGATLSFGDVTEVFLADERYQGFTFVQDVVSVVLLCGEFRQEVFHGEPGVLLLCVMFKQ